MKNFLTQYTGIFRFLNSTRNLWIKCKNPHVLIGRNCILKNVRFERLASLGEGVRLSDSVLGNHTYISAGSILNNTEIGRFCSVGPDVKAGLGVHPVSEFISTHPAFYSPKKQSGASFVADPYFNEEKKVIIGHDVWIGTNAVIMDGIQIGNGAIIGAGAIVTKNVAPFEIVAGVPAKHIRFRFTPEEILKIENSEWWKKDEAWLKKNAALFRDKEKFFQLQVHK